MDRLQHPEITAEPPSAEIAAPELPGFAIQGVLGHGGMGIVWRAVELSTGRTVALKVLSETTLRQAKSARRFQLEIDLTRECVHPHVVQALGSGEHLGQSYMVMERIDGVDLAHAIRVHGRLSVEAACEVIRQAALGLHHAHELGFVHRDVKPSNLLLTSQGVVKLADLGLARIADGPSQSALTSADQIMGAVDYLVPEQVRAGEKVDLQSDIYSLGATLFKLLTGAAPFEGDDYDSLVRKIAALTSGAAPDIADRRGDVPDELADIVSRMFASKPDERSSSAHEVAVALAPFCEKHELVDVCSSAAAAKSKAKYRQTETLGQASTPVHVAVQADDAANATRRWKGLMAGVAGVLLLLLAVVITLATDGGEIVVESSDPNLQLQVVRNGATVEEWSAGQLSDYTWFRSGDYEIRVPRESQDRFTIKDGRFKLKRNDRHVVKINVVSVLPTAQDGTLQLPAEPELLDIWSSSDPQLSNGDRSVDVLLSDDWEWTEAKPLGRAINDGIDAHIPASPSLAPDGLTIMFGRHADGFRWLVASRDSLQSEFEVQHLFPRFPLGATYGYSLGSFARQIVCESDRTSFGEEFDHFDLFAFSVTDRGEWREDQIFDAVNSDWHEEETTFSADGRTLVFASARPGGCGNLDLWMATRTSTTVPFNAAMPLGDPINTAASGKLPGNVFRRAGSDLCSTR